LIWKRTYFLLLVIGFAFTVQAQISPLADQYLLNSFLTNPANVSTEAKGFLSVLARRQWTGILGAPSWQSATYHTTLRNKHKYFTKNGFVNKGENLFGNIGVGGGLFNIKYGAISQTGIHLNYAYHISLIRGSRLTFGLAPMFHQFVINKSDFNPPDGTSPDPLIDGSIKEALHIFDFNVGLHYYSEFMFAGLSAVQLLNSAVSFGQLSYSSIDGSFHNPYLTRSFYLYSGITRGFGKSFSVEPSVVLKYNNVSKFGFQINLGATINKIFRVGLLYHYNESAGFFAGLKAGDLIFRYQFELPVGPAGLMQFTTHQILVGYLL
jgi:type IX secretion system PorP/SprF family membrane protein